MLQFVHLHVHTHYSILDGMSKIPLLVDRARNLGMNALAITDHGNMFGIKEFSDYVKNINKKAKPEEKFKPIFGVEAYCARRTLHDKDKNKKEINPETGREQIVDLGGYHIILLAKNKAGYKNLCKIISISWIDGFYGRPRIDKKILEKYSEGLIVCSACLGGEIPQLIIKGELEEAKNSIMWFKKIFGSDYYLEIQRHKTNKIGGDTSVYERQKEVNKILLELAHETDTKIIATNDVHFVDEDHGEAHDRLICLSTGKYLDEEDRLRYTKQEWLKSSEEMYAIFSDIPEALTTTQKIADSVELYDIDSGPIMPMFDIPAEFGDEDKYRKKFSEADLFKEFTRDEKGNEILDKDKAQAKINELGGYEKLYRIKLEADYLAKLTWKGAEVRYPELTQEIKDRITYELHIMKTMGYPGYFLIVQDFISAARKMGVSVGPGRGSAAGSVVAYCLEITNIDPLKYNLLFERFLNPDRISLPDIDIDFDDEGRGEVLRWVTEKYGKERVAHIITYGTMATKSSIADVGRVQRIPLAEVNAIKTYIPDKFDESLNDKQGKSPKINIKNCLKYVPKLQEAMNGGDKNISNMLKYAEMLEGTVRQTGVHACGVIIGARDLTEFIPLSVAKDKETDEDILVTQYEGSAIESVGLVKMDFLGLKTLSIIKEAVKNIKHSKGIDLDIEKIPIDDKETYDLYSKGQTIGIFQFESPGMQKYLKELKPTVFEDLIAMNALYRPGPMQYIPQFIARKFGREPIVYDIPIMETYLKETYGITVYQEQVMLLSRLLANFTRGESDNLRKAMGKKQRDKLDLMKPNFIEQGQKNGHNPKILDKIWTDWEHFASYAFNKSHATCYSWVSYQTAYLKTHFPSEFMAASLTSNLNDITEVSKFMDECKAMGIEVLPPSVSESESTFTVNKKGNIRFGLAAIKGVGMSAVENIIKTREEKPFEDIFDFVSRVNLSSINKKTIESLAKSGAFDEFEEIKREQFFESNPKGEIFIETLVKYGSLVQQDKITNANCLFGDSHMVECVKPEIPRAADWSVMEKLGYEQELVGMYLSSHPLDLYKFEINTFANTTISQLENLDEFVSKKIAIIGVVQKSEEQISKTGNPYGRVTIQDYSGSFSTIVGSKQWIQFKNFFTTNYFILAKATVKEKWQPIKKDENNKIVKNNEPTKYDLVFTEVSLLQNVRDEFLKSIKIIVPIERINATFNDEFLKKIKKNKGKKQLILVFKESEKNIYIEQSSRKFMVEINADLLDFLKEKDLEYIVEKK